MRIETNFFHSFDRAGVPVLAGLGWGMALLGLALAVCLLLDGLQLKGENPSLQKRLSELRQEPLQATTQADLPSAEDLAGLRRRLQELNRLDAGEGPSTAELLAQMERMTPPGVRLLSFQNDRESGGVQLVAEAPDLDDLSGFLATLEKSDSFSSVNLSKQTQAQDSSGRWIQFTVDLTENVE